MCILLESFRRQDHGAYIPEYANICRGDSVAGQRHAQCAEIHGPAGKFFEFFCQDTAGHAGAERIHHHAHLEAEGCNLFLCGFRRTRRFWFPGFRRHCGECEKIFHWLADEDGDGIGDAAVPALAIDGAVNCGEIAPQDGGDGLLVDALGVEFVFYGLR